MSTTEDPRIHGESFDPCHDVGDLSWRKWHDVCHQGTFGALTPGLSGSLLAGQLGR